MCTILVVDDDTAVLEMLERSLARAGYDVVTAANGREALDLLEEARPGLVLTDVYMPEKDGIELIQELARMSARPRLIAMSGGGMLKDPTMLMVAGKLGAVRTLPKPFGNDELLLAVKEALAH